MVHKYVHKGDKHDHRDMLRSFPDPVTMRIADKIVPIFIHNIQTEVKHGSFQTIQSTETDK